MKKWTTYSTFKQKIDENREKSLLIRDKIRNYAERNFGWNVFIEKYINNIRN